MPASDMVLRSGSVKLRLGRLVRGGRPPGRCIRPNNKKQEKGHLTILPQDCNEDEIGRAHV